MFTHEDLIEVHRRMQHGSEKLLVHCAQFSEEEFNRVWEGFGDPSLLLIWQHIIGCEDYWVNVLKGAWNIEDLTAPCMTVEALDLRRQEIMQQTVDYINSRSIEELNMPAEFGTWPEGNRRALIPAMVLMRLLTHAYQHRGQIIAICRMLGKPCPPSDFQIVP